MKIADLTNPSNTLMLVFTVCLTVSAGSGCSPSGGIKITPVPADKTLRMETVVQESGWVSEKIAIIDIEGILENAERGGFFDEGENPVAITVEKLDAAARMSSVKAVILRINSPGGMVTASDILYQEVRRFREKTGKPVIAMLMDVAASGGYYVACGADEIIAQRTTVTGSIGVIMQMFSLEGALKKIGVKTDAITSGAMKDAGSPLREMTPEEREIFSGIIDDLYKRFLEVVRAGRPNLTEDKLVSIADGRIYTAEQALENGLIDRIGTLWDAIEAAKAKAGLKRANTVVFRRPLSWRPNVYAQAPGGPSGGLVVNFFNLNLEKLFTRHPVFLYLWVL
jgi:protease-4